MRKVYKKESVVGVTFLKNEKDHILVFVDGRQIKYQKHKDFKFVDSHMKVKENIKRGVIGMLRLQTHQENTEVLAFREN